MGFASLYPSYDTGTVSPVQTNKPYGQTPDMMAP